MKWLQKIRQTKGVFIYIGLAIVLFNGFFLEGIPSILIMMFGFFLIFCGIDKEK